ncbi:MAG: site-2 protease family protein [Alphaproteobacteria bacterium]|nr:site-2 protease family protein [Alphaproteobacteria bacterium]
MEQILFKASTWILPVLFSIIGHEISHGMMAFWLGDKTAYNRERLSINPIKHIDKVGTIILPLLLFLSNAGVVFGWAKPVPVNFSNLKHPKRDTFLVALAGPLFNFLLAILCFLGIFFLGKPSTFLPLWVYFNLLNTSMLSLGLMAFNLFPLLPLDGGRMLGAVLPQKMEIKYAKTEKYGFLLLLILLFVLPYLGVNLIGLFAKFILQNVLSGINFLLLIFLKG